MRRRAAGGVGSTAGPWIQTVAPGRVASASSGCSGAERLAGALCVRDECFVARVTVRLAADGACRTARAVGVAEDTTTRGAAGFAVADAVGAAGFASALGAGAACG